jgi:RNA repair, ligase-Pnkp-associating, region of Hen1
VLLAITTTHRPATDLGCLFHQHLDTVSSVSLPFGQAMVRFSRADDARCTASVMLQAQPARPSFVGVALAELFGPALESRGDSRPEVAGRPLPFEVDLSAVACVEGPALPRRLFGPLGYHVVVAPVPADPRFPAGACDDHLALRLTGIVRLADLLSHLCVLLPVLDGRREAGLDDRVGELLPCGEPWIASHPESTLIARRYARSHTTRVV